MSDLKTLETRWDAFLGKVRARMEEIRAEAAEGLDALIKTEIVDMNPLTNALTELKSRFYALEKKVEKAWDDTIGPEAEAFDEDAQRARVDAMEGKREALLEDLRRVSEALEIDADEKAAAKLEAIAKEERAKRKLTCTKCGAPLPEPAVQHRADNVTCPHCQAVNTVRPGLAATMAHHARERVTKLAKQRRG